MPKCHPLLLFVWFSASHSFGWHSVPSSWASIPPHLSRGISLVVLFSSPADGGIVSLFFFSLAHPPRTLFSLLQDSAWIWWKNQNSWVLEGLVHYFKSRMEKNSGATLRGVDRGRQRERSCCSSNSPVGAPVVCIAGKVRKESDLWHEACSLLLPPTHHFLPKPLHFFLTPCVPCPVNADERR